jgi:hypothetical protein
MHELNVCTLCLRVVSTDIDCKPRLIYMDMRLQFEPGGDSSFEPGYQGICQEVFGLHKCKSVAIVMLKTPMCTVSSVQRQRANVGRLRVTLIYNTTSAAGLI